MFVEEQTGKAVTKIIQFNQGKDDNSQGYVHNPHSIGMSNGILLEDAIEMTPFH